MGKLALTGGTPHVDGSLDNEWPVSDERDEQALMEVLRSGAWTRSKAQGPDSCVWRFEDAFAAFQDARYGVAVATGSVGMELALKAVGVEAGDEVIIPAATWITVATSVIAVGAAPVFVDIDPGTYNIDVAKAAAAISPRTRAIMCVHNGGLPADLDALRKVADKHGIALVGDCAHAHGSQWQGRGVGAIEDAGVFSFQGSKVLPLGEGGMVLTDNEDLQARLFGLQHVNGIAERPKPKQALPATNLRMSEWIGSLGLVGLERLPQQIANREENARYLMQGLAEIQGVDGLIRDPRVTRWSFYIWHWRFVEAEFEGIRRDTFLAALKAEGVPVSTGQTAPLYRHPALTEMNCGRTNFPFNAQVYGREMDYSSFHCPETERIAADEALAFSHTVFLGSQQRMDQILDAVRKIRENVADLHVWEQATTDGTPA
jgi:dTDP-4-amino-4,6-dideoxygalactose transaminase